MIYLVLSLDYEIFGNGAGDVMRDIIQPTSRLLDICDKHGAKMTIMFEVGEYWAFERYDNRLRRDLAYSPCAAMKKQATEAVERGHDVQLHLHPQWIGAEYRQGAWRLHNLFWRLADLPEGLGSPDQVTSITGALYKNKRTLEEMIKPVKADYECVCFRAGGFYAQPSCDIIRAMKRVGLKSDSSVVRGYRINVPFEVDYSHVETDKAAWWTTDTELTKEGRPGENIIEVSVSSRMEPYWRNFKMTRFRAALQRWKIERASRSDHAAGKRISSVPANRTVLMNLLKKRASTFDFCKLSTRDMLDRARQHVECLEQPIIMIGHSKDFFNDRALDRFLAEMRHDKQITFQSLSGFMNSQVGNCDGRMCDI